jgi:aminopeptidase
VFWLWDKTLPPNPKDLSNVDPSKVRLRAGARKEINDIWMKRAAEGKLKWTLLPYPVSSAAQEASMALPEYEDFVYKSCFVDKKNPIAEWRKMQAEQEKICERLNNVSEMRIVGEDTDLTFNVKGRKWLNCCGLINMPDGEVYTGPVEDSVNGTIRFTYPGIYYGKEAEDIRLTFKKGKVVKASAAKGEDLLKEILKIKNADRLGGFC